MSTLSQSAKLLSLEHNHKICATSKDIKRTQAQIELMSSFI